MTTTATAAASMMVSRVDHGPRPTIGPVTGRERASLASLMAYLECLSRPIRPDYAGDRQARYGRSSFWSDNP